MKKRNWKKIAIISTSVFLSLVLILAVHIYWVTRPKTADPNLRVMARVDFKQDINQQDADKITAWMYQEKGVDHVLCNPESNILVFTFFPVKNSANQIISDLKTSLPYKGDRFMPTEQQMKEGCPVSLTTSYKVVAFIKNIF